jgi:hypothetical protein
LAAYQARPKATPTGSTQAEPQARVRRDVVDSDGKLTLRHNGRLHHIGIGRTHARTPILMLINGLHIRIIHATTGELIRRGRGSAEELSKIIKVLERDEPPRVIHCSLEGWRYSSTGEASSRM